MDKIINFDSMIKKKKYRNNNKLSLQHPCRAVLFGPSGCGKSTALINLLINPLTKMTYDKIYLYAKQLDEELYEWFINKIEKIEEKLSKQAKEEIKIIHTASKLEDVIPVDMMDKTQQNLIIFDDMIVESETAQQVILDYFIRGRKMNCSMIYLSQSFYAIPKDIRGNVNYLLLYNVSNRQDIKRLFKDSIRGIDWDDFINKYNEIIGRNIHGFLTVDMVTNEPKLRIREGITG